MEEMKGRGGRDLLAVAPAEEGEEAGDTGLALKAMLLVVGKEIVGATLSEDNGAGSGVNARGKAGEVVAKEREEREGEGEVQLESLHLERANRGVELADLVHEGEVAVVEVGVVAALKDG